MKRLITYLIATLVICSCASTRKVTKTDIRTESELIVQTKDSTITSTTWQSFLLAIESSIDLSTLHLISYYPQKDTTTGKQLVKEEVTVQKNVTATKKTVQQEKADIKESTEIVTDITQKVKQDVKQEVLQKKGSSNLKLYIIIALLGITVLGLVYLWVRRIIKF